MVNRGENSRKSSYDTDREKREREREGEYGCEWVGGWVGVCVCVFKKTKMQ